MSRSIELHATPRTVLVADDDDDMRALMVATLKRDGYKVVEAKDGGELLERLRDAYDETGERFDIVVTDVRMPRLSGLGVLQELKRARMHLPVIVVTVFGDDSMHIVARRLGAIGVLGMDLHDLVEKNGFWPQAAAAAPETVGDPVLPPAVDGGEEARPAVDPRRFLTTSEAALEQPITFQLRPGGVLEALVEAKEQGKVRYVGFTGHKSPWHHREMLRRGFPFDACMMPLNVMDYHFRSFEQEVVPELVERGIGVIGMKSQGGGRITESGAVTPEEAIRYTVGMPGLSTLVSGILSLEHLQQNADAACRPMDQAERVALRERVRPVAVDGRLELYKIGIHFEGWAAREQHGLQEPGSPC